jgi:hypothetical protein
MIGYFLGYLTTLYQLQCLKRKCLRKYLDVRLINKWAFRILRKDRLREV